MRFTSAALIAATIFASAASSAAQPQPQTQAEAPPVAPPAPGDAPSRARARYDEGARAYEAREFVRAARLFAEADVIEANPVALRLALAAVSRADDPVLAITLARRTEGRDVDAATADLARRVRARFGGSVGYVRVVCASGPCRARVAGQEVDGGGTVVVPIGPVDATIEGTTLRFRLQVPPRATVDLVEPAAHSDVAPSASPSPSPSPAPLFVAPPPARPAETPRRGGGLSPAAFWLGLGVTAVLGGATIASGLDTRSQHDAFLRDPTPDARDRGRSAEVRTNVLLVATAVSAAATGLVGIAFTRWSGSRGDVR